MKILEHPKPFSMIIDCGSCGAKLETETSDVKYGDFGTGYGGDVDWKYYVRCPCCDMANFVDVPRYVQRKIERD